MTTSPSLLFIRQNTVTEIVIGYSDDEQTTTHAHEKANAGTDKIFSFNLELQL